VLLELNVKGFGIIEEISWNPSAGFNVITGETGAGKSLVVDAVEALLSGQVQEEDIRYGSEEAQIEGIFSLPRDTAPEQLRTLLSQKGLGTDEDTLVITCDFRRQGRVIQRVNRQAVSRSLLRDIGYHLVDIHGQSGHLSLLDKEQHLEFLDAYAHTSDLRHVFSVRTSELHQAERELQSLFKNEQELSRQIELLNFQIDEIRRARLGEGEEETLARELAILTSSQKLKASAQEIYSIICGDESISAATSASDILSEALPPLKQITATDPSLKKQLDYLEEMVQGLAELARDIRSYGDNLEYDPRRLEEVQARLDLIRSLKRKYGSSIVEILAFQEKTEKELEGLNFSSERREQLQEKIIHLKNDMGTLAFQLSGKRLQAAQQLAAAVKKECAELNMSRVDFAVSMTRGKSPEGIPFPDGELYQFNASGVDNVEFMASTNPGEPLKPLAKIASSGEISRFMLALKGALAEADMIPVLIFDEIDVGIGGRSGEVIGKKLWRLAQSHQVICVTHLPQIAAFADAHYSVSKKSSGKRTVSTIAALQNDARLNELATMIAGPQYTANALNAAGELTQKADTWKKDYQENKHSVRRRSSVVNKTIK
jgi:DNA repair protein RecN (Recombination protein N)